MQLSNSRIRAVGLESLDLNEQAHSTKQQDRNTQRETLAQLFHFLEFGARV